MLQPHPRCSHIPTAAACQQGQSRWQAKLHSATLSKGQGGHRQICTPEFLSLEGRGSVTAGAMAATSGWAVGVRCTHCCLSMGLSMPCHAASSSRFPVIAPLLSLPALACSHLWAFAHAEVAEPLFPELALQCSSTCFPSLTCCLPSEVVSAPGIKILSLLGRSLSCLCLPSTCFRFLCRVGLVFGAPLCGWC